MRGDQRENAEDFLLSVLVMNGINFMWKIKTLFSVFFVKLVFHYLLTEARTTVYVKTFDDLVVRVEIENVYVSRPVF